MDLSRYGSVFGAAIGLQVVVFVITLSTLDGGAAGITALCAFLAFWCAVGLLVRRHRELPTEGALAFIRWGYLPMLLAAVAAHEVAWNIAH